MESHLRKIENLPVVMTDPSQINYAVDTSGFASGSLPEGNLIRDFYIQRAAITDGAVDGYFPVFNESLNLYFHDQDLILHRRAPGEHGAEPTYHLIDGVPTVHARPHPNEPAIKFNSKLVFSKNTLMITFNKKFDGTPLNQITNDELRKRRIAEYTLKQAVINVFRRHSRKKVYLNGNDTLIEGKKLSGGEAFVYDHQFHEHTMYTWLYEPDLFDRYLKFDGNHINSLQKRGLILKNNESTGSVTGAYGGITGIANEIPGYTKEEFAADVLKEIQYFLFMVQ